MSLEVPAAQGRTTEAASCVQYHQWTPEYVCSQTTAVHTQHGCNTRADVCSYTAPPVNNVSSVLCNSLPLNMKLTKTRDFWQVISDISLEPFICFWCI